MKVELTLQQADVLVEALGLALAAVPPAQRVAVSVNQYAPIVQALQQAAQPAQRVAVSVNQYAPIVQALQQAAQPVDPPTTDET
jgi:uncharacterized protein (DUF1778 family)